MDYGQLLHEARAVESRCLESKEFWEDLVQSLNSLDNEALSLSNQLFELNSEVSNLQDSVTHLNEKKNKLEMDVDTATEQFKKYEFLKTHLDALKQRKHLLDAYSLEKGLEFEEKTYEEKLDDVWKYFKEKNCKLDEEIKEANIKFENRKALVSKTYEGLLIKYEKKLKQLDKENDFLSEKLNFMKSKLQED